MLLKNMDHFVELGEGVKKLNQSLALIDQRKTEAKNIKEEKKKLMVQNQGLLQEIQIKMANEEKANQMSEQLTNDFRNLEKADIQIRNEMKHNVSKIGKAKENIEEINKKK